MRRALPLAGLAGLVLAACTPSASIHGPFIATAGFEDYQRVGRRVDGSSCEYRFQLLVPVGMSGFGKAYAEAMAKAPESATGLSSASMSVSSYWMPAGFLYCLRVSGVPARLTLPPPEGSDGS